MHEKLSNLASTSKIAAMSPTAQRVLLAWLLDHPQRVRPSIQRTQNVLGVSRATAYRGIAELRLIEEGIVQAVK